MTASRGILRALKKRYPWFTDLEEHGLVTFNPPKPVNQSGGTLGRPMKFFRDVVRAYKALPNSRHRNQDVMVALNLNNVAQARDAVYRARKMGLLPPTKRGRAKI